MPDKAQVERILVFLERSGYEAERLAETRKFLTDLTPVDFTVDLTGARYTHGAIPFVTLPEARRSLTVYHGKPETASQLAALLLANYDTLTDGRLLEGGGIGGGSSRNVDQLIARLLDVSGGRSGAREQALTSDPYLVLPQPGDTEGALIDPALADLDDGTWSLVTSVLSTQVRAALDDTLLTAEEREAGVEGGAEDERDPRLAVRERLDAQLETLLTTGNQRDQATGYLTLRRDAEGTLWYSSTGGDLEMALEIPDDLAAYEALVQTAFAGGDLTPFTWHDPETGALNTRVADSEDFAIPIPESDKRYIGNIPASYVSNRLIVKPNPDDPTDFDFRQRRYEARFGEYTDDPYMVHRFGEAGRDRPEIVYAGPVHEEWDPYALFAGKDPAYLAMTQRLLLDAGYLDPQDVVGTPGGYWLSNQAEAAASWLFEANVNGFGNDPFRFLEDLASQGRAVKEAQDAEDARQGRTSSGRSGPKYHAPDYATLAQAVKQTVSAKVGRDVKDYEMTLLAEKLAADHRAQFDAAVSAAGGGTSGANRDIGDIADYMLRNQEAGLPATAGLDAFLAGFDPTVTTKPYLDPYASDLDDLNPQVPDPDGARSPAEFPADYVAPTGGGGGGTVQDVDPMARLEENVESMFATEIDRNKRVADIRGNTHHMMNVLAGLEGA